MNSVRELIGLIERTTRDDGIRFRIYADGSGAIISQSDETYAEWDDVSEMQNELDELWRRHLGLKERSRWVI